MHRWRGFSGLTLVSVAIAGWLALANDRGWAEERPMSLVIQGRIWTGDPARPWAVAVEGARIVAVGTSGEVAARVGDAAPVIEAGDGLVVPGMCDSHIHKIKRNLPGRR